MLQIDWGYYSLILNFDIRRRFFHLEKKKKKRFLFAFRSLIRNFAHMNEELFRTIVPLPKAPFHIGAAEQVLCIGSCFADEIGRRFQDDHFPTVANPYGVMYNPASILHSVTKVTKCQNNKATLAILTLGTNHVYIDRATDEIVDNCQKRPARDFEERVLSVDECADYLRRSIQLLHEWNPEMKIILTVSPIRYRKYGYHESQLSKATLLMAVEKVAPTPNPTQREGSLASFAADNGASNANQAPLPLGWTGDALLYFPSYEILLDELRDYRFYAPDMLHPSPQAVDYIYRRFQDCFFSDEARQYVSEWRPIREALAHRPFNPDSSEYQTFRKQTLQRQQAFEQKWHKRE